MKKGNLFSLFLVGTTLLLVVALNISLGSKLSTSKQPAAVGMADTTSRQMSSSSGNIGVSGNEYDFLVNFLVSKDLATRSSTQSQVSTALGRYQTSKGIAATGTVDTITNLTITSDFLGERGYTGEKYEGAMISDLESIFNGTYVQVRCGSGKIMGPDGKCIDDPLVVVGPTDECPAGKYFDGQDCIEIPPGQETLWSRCNSVCAANFGTWEGRNVCMNGGTFDGWTTKGCVNMGPIAADPTGNTQCDTELTNCTSSCQVGQYGIIDSACRNTCFTKFEQCVGGTVSVGGSSGNEIRSSGNNNDSGVVSRIKTDLKVLGYYRGIVISDSYGNKVATAVRNFQQANGLPATGQLDAATRIAIQTQASTERNRGANDPTDPTPPNLDEIYGKAVGDGGGPTNPPPPGYENNDECKYGFRTGTAWCDCLYQCNNGYGLDNLDATSYGERGSCMTSCLGQVAVFPTDQDVKNVVKTSPCGSDEYFDGEKCIDIPPGQETLWSQCNSVCSANFGTWEGRNVCMNGGTFDGWTTVGCVNQKYSSGNFDGDTTVEPIQMTLNECVALYGLANCSKCFGTPNDCKPFGSATGPDGAEVQITMQECIGTFIENSGGSRFNARRWCKKGKGVAVAPTGADMQMSMKECMDRVWGGITPGLDHPMRFLEARRVCKANMAVVKGSGANSPIKNSSVLNTLYSDDDTSNQRNSNPGSSEPTGGPDGSEWGVAGNGGTTGPTVPPPPGGFATVRECVNFILGNNGAGYEFTRLEARHHCKVNFFGAGGVNPVANSISAVGDDDIDMDDLKAMGDDDIDMDDLRAVDPASPCTSDEYFDGEKCIDIPPGQETLWSQCNSVCSANFGTWEGRNVCMNGGTFDGWTTVGCVNQKYVTGIGNGGAGPEPEIWDWCGTAFSLTADNCYGDKQCYHNAYLDFLRCAQNNPEIMTDINKGMLAAKGDDDIDMDDLKVIEKGPNGPTFPEPPYQSRRQCIRDLTGHIDSGDGHSWGRGEARRWCNGTDAWLTAGGRGGNNPGPTFPDPTTPAINGPITARYNTCDAQKIMLVDFEVTPTEGVPPYTYTWATSPASLNTTSANGGSTWTARLRANTEYTVIVRVEDSAGSTQSYRMNITPDCRLGGIVPAGTLGEGATTNCQVSYDAGQTWYVGTYENSDPNRTCFPVETATIPSIR